MPILSNVGVTSTSSLVSNSRVFKSSDNTRLDDIFRCFSVCGRTCLNRSRADCVTVLRAAEREGIEGTNARDPGQKSGTNFVSLANT